MAESKNIQEREELHKAIWAIADELRGAVDGWDFKAYVLGTMFYRFLSESITNYLNEQVWGTGDTQFNYTEMTDEETEAARDDTIAEKGFFLLPSELFVIVG